MPRCAEALEVTTIEGLDSDPIIIKLREAFSQEHGLQCGFCTPGMLVTARDILLRCRDANERRICVELGGNLCRCTGYAGIVRAIQSVQAAIEPTREVRPARSRPLAPVGSTIAQETEQRVTRSVEKPVHQKIRMPETPISFGLGGKSPNVRMSQSFVIRKPIDEVWSAFEDVSGVAACLPGARLTSDSAGDIVEGSFSAKLGPIAAMFSGKAKISRDKSNYSGVILGGGHDQKAGSRASGEVDYKLVAQGSDETTVQLEIRALIAGALAQFGRSGIVDDLAKRIIKAFSENLERKLSGASADQLQASLNAGSLVMDVVSGRIKQFVASLRRLLTLE